MDGAIAEAEDKVTDQFSQEYIDYILSDEAKALQERDGWQLGDWCYDQVTTQVLLVSHSDGKMYASDIWLPTLWDLVRIIEGAGWDWTVMSGWTSNDEGFYQLQSGKATEACAHTRDSYDWHTVESGEQSDVMLAAAKLAVRALGIGE